MLFAVSIVTIVISLGKRWERGEKNRNSFKIGAIVNYEKAED